MRGDEASLCVCSCPVRCVLCALCVAGSICACCPLHTDVAALSKLLDPTAGLGQSREKTGQSGPLVSQNRLAGPAAALARAMPCAGPPRANDSAPGPHHPATSVTSRDNTSTVCQCHDARMLREAVSIHSKIWAQELRGLGRRMGIMSTPCVLRPLLGLDSTIRIGSTVVG